MGTVGGGLPSRHMLPVQQSWWFWGTQALMGMGWGWGGGAGQGSGQTQVKGSREPAAPAC